MKKSGDASQRCLRVGEEIRRNLALIFQEESFWHPTLMDSTITIIEVRVSPDLGHAKVFFLRMGTADIEDIARVLKEERHAIYKLLAKKIRLRIMPELHFIPDVSFEQVQNIESLLKTPKVRKDVGK